MLVTSPRPSLPRPVGHFRLLAAALLGACLLAAAAGCAHKPAHPTSMATAQPDHEKTFQLWPEGPPEAKGSGVRDIPTISVYLPPPDKATGAAVVVSPGGGYWVLAADHEGVQVARWLNREGIAAFVLHYRLRPEYDPEVAIADGKRAMRWARARAERYGVSPNRIGMMGFSAGGNLASSVGTDPEPGASEGQPGYEDEVERQYSRPDFLLLVYPALSHQVSEKQIFGRSTETLVSEQTPPSFLVHTHEDDLTPAHSVRFYEQLLAFKIPAELHIFTKGPHGTGIAPGDPDLGEWRQLAMRWLRRSGFLAPGKRVAIQGTLNVNGAPLTHGWLTLIPENDRFPVVAAYVGAKDGTFAIPAAEGPYPGRYRVQAHVLSTPAADNKLGKTSLEDAVVAAAPAGSRKDEPLWIEVVASQQKPMDLKLRATSGKLP